MDHAPISRFPPFGEVVFDLTALVQDWVNGIRTNNGILLKAGAEDFEIGQFYVPHTVFRGPRLVVDGNAPGSAE